MRRVREFCERIYVREATQASVYRAADDEAKVLEQQAKGLRQAANDKKKLAGQAKDEACETRPGGKLLCIRGFGSGY